MLEQFGKIGKDALADLKKVTDLAALEEFRIKYLGRKGQITQMLSQVGGFAAEQRPQAGQLANKIKKEVGDAFERLKNNLSQSQQESREFIDVTLPGIPASIGKPHVITQTTNELLSRGLPTKTASMPLRLNQFCSVGIARHLERYYRDTERLACVGTQ